MLKANNVAIYVLLTMFRGCAGKILPQRLGKCKHFLPAMWKAGIGESNIRLPENKGSTTQVHVEDKHPYSLANLSYVCRLCVCTSPILFNSSCFRKINVLLLLPLAYSLYCRYTSWIILQAAWWINHSWGQTSHYLWSWSIFWKGQLLLRYPNLLTDYGKIVGNGNGR